MITSTGTITSVDLDHNRISVLVEHGVFFVDVPAWKIDQMEEGMTVKVKYIPDDQFATLLPFRYLASVV